MTGAPYPRFPVKCRGSRELHAPFLKERRTRGRVQGGVHKIRGICPVLADVGFHGCPLGHSLRATGLDGGHLHLVHSAGRCSWYPTQAKSGLEWGTRHSLPQRAVRVGGPIFFFILAEDVAYTDNGCYLFRSQSIEQIPPH
jgi:hypothetical protein